MCFIWHWEWCMLVKVCVCVCVCVCLCACYARGWVALRHTVLCDAWTRYYEHPGIGGSEDTVPVYRRRENLIFEHCAAIMLPVRDWLYLSWREKGIFDWALCCSRAVSARLTVLHLEWEGDIWLSTVLQQDCQCETDYFTWNEKGIFDWALCCSNAASVRLTVPQLEWKGDIWLSTVLQ